MEFPSEFGNERYREGFFEGKRANDEVCNRLKEEKESTDRLFEITQQQKYAHLSDSSSYPVDTSVPSGDVGFDEDTLASLRESSIRINEFLKKHQ